MTPDLRQRLSAALDEMQSLGPGEAERYLRALGARDPELAGRLGALLNLPRASTSGPTGRPEPAPSSVVPLSPDPAPGASVRDARSTASFRPPGAPGAGGPAGARVLDRYQLVRALGRGAFGDVWLALDPVLQKHVAVKVARPDRPATDGAFLDEARKAASLPKHPALVHVYDVCGGADGWFIISEYIDGTSLRERLEAGPVPRGHAVRIVATVAGALHAAHLAGLVHRDVKPGNILIDRAGNAHLTDFGLAVREEEQFAERSRVSGTLAYMSPEQINGDTHLLDGRADIYALGAVLYELLTGRPVFRGSDVDEYRELILRREPRPPRAIDATVPEELERICLKCLAKEVKDRYRTAQDLAADLEAWLTESTRSFTLPAPAPPRNRWKWVAGGAAALALVAATVALVQSAGRDRPAPPENPPAGAGPAEPAGPVGVAPRRAPAVKPLLWFDVPRANEWSVLANPEQLKVYTDSLSLLQLGEAPAGSWELSATIKQVAAAGNVGLFLGHRSDPRTATATYEVVRLLADPNAMHLQRRVETYRLDNPLRGFEGETHTSALVPHAQEYAIRLVVRDNRLVEVWLNGAPVPELAPGPRTPPAAGSFGAYNRQSDGVFWKLSFNDRPVPLFAEANAPPKEKP